MSREGRFIEAQQEELRKGQVNDNIKQVGDTQGQSERLRCGHEDEVDARKETVAPGLSFLHSMQFLLEMLHLGLSPVLIFCFEDKLGLWSNLLDCNTQFSAPWFAFAIKTWCLGTFLFIVVLTRIAFEKTDAGWCWCDPAEQGLQHLSH